MMTTSFHEMSIYEKCIELASRSPCKKRGFGCVATYYDEILPTSYSYNKHLDETEHLCKPECIRNSIPSGSDSMIGACVHAEDVAIWNIIKVHHSLHRMSIRLYVAGVSKPDNIPLVKSDPHFYCIRCATTMLLSGIEGVNVYVESRRWVFLTAQEAYETSLEYALRQKKLEGNMA